VLTDPVRINVGQVGEANADVLQVAVVLNSDAEKLPWVRQSMKSVEMATAKLTTRFACFKVSCVVASCSSGCRRYVWKAPSSSSFRDWAPWRRWPRASAKQTTNVRHAPRGTTMFTDSSHRRLGSVL